MFKKLQKILPYATFSVLAFVFSTHQAHADFFDIGNIALGVVDSVVASVSQIVMFVMHYWVAATAALFSVSINLNLHIKQFVDATEGVYTVWKTIRDVCSLFIIFMLLYTAIKLILSQEEKGLEGVGHLIKNIVIAGILINFSFFITGLLIDASNMVSLAIYKGIVSTDSSQNAGAINNSNLNVSAMTNNLLSPTKGGPKDASLADFFMTKLSPQSAFKLELTDKGGANSDGTPAPLRTLIQGVVGSVIMFTIGMSFLFASIAFASRLVILVILLAFSSIWFASWIFPSLKDKSDEFVKILKGQLIFMPVYLLLLYGALVVLNKSTIFTNTANTSGAGWLNGYIILAINDFFIIFLLNLPLVTAFAFAKESTGWLKADRFNANNVWKNVGGFVGNRAQDGGKFAWRNTGGIAASRINNSESMHSFIAKNPNLGKIVTKNVGKVASTYDKRQEENRKEADKLNKQIGTVDRAQYNTEEEYKKAKDAAKLAQYEHSANLSQPKGLLSVLLTTRGARRSGYSSKEKADNAAAGKDAKDSLKRFNDSETKLKIDRAKAMEKHGNETTTLESNQKNIEAEIKNISEQIKNIEASNVSKLPSNRTTTTNLKDSLSKAQEKLATIQKEKTDKEIERRKAAEEMEEELTKIQENKIKAQADIDAAKEQLEKEEFEKLQTAFKESGKQNESPKTDKPSK